MSASTLFREKALARLAAPEELEQRIRIVPPLGWAALLTCAVLLAAALAWGILGTYRMTAAGQGVLVQANGMFVGINAPKSGWLEHLAATGERVEQGALIARLRAPEEDARVAGLEERLRELHTQGEAVRARYAERLSQEEQAAATRRRGLQETAGLTASRITELENLLRTREGLAGSGLVTTERVVDVRERLFAAREALSRTRTDLDSLEAGLLSLRAQRDAEVEGLARQEVEVQGQLDQARLSRSLATEIRASVAGEVVMTPATRFSLVSAGQRLLVVETGEETLEALLFVPADAGKQVRPGMEVRLSPSTARREEYGALVGTVHSVSPVPVSQQEVADLLANQDLARQLAGDRAPLLVRVALRPSPAPGSANPYAWTSSKGREVTVENGMLVAGDVTVRAAPPIELVIPALRRWTGL
ncbi:NHLP bacteriocin system secretion protein [Sabulicella rubraurantiaca]|uniref:NHLP bacteriocin system secretion protein n=1 Tax=Sabulicella rubraurantiaca TaxID=2811429 RepID=UPI001A9797D5|nr:NHLP bacteriocin system secretion protein [Sabulicella rubraurantiaca]